MDQATALQEVGKLGEMFSNDLDDEIDGTGGKFGFQITEPDANGARFLKATFEPCLDEAAPREDNGDYGKPQTFRWMIIEVPQK